MSRKPRQTDSRSEAKKIIDATREATLVQAKHFLENLHTDIQCRIDGINDDLRNRGVET